MLSEMICVSDKFFVRKARRHSFQERLQLFTGLMNVQRGLVGLRVIPPSKGNTPFVVESTWLSRDHFQDWIASSTFVLSTGALCGNAADPIVHNKQTELLAVNDIPLRFAA
ncbi:MAG: antibiotic biosynthesis monooxygenase [Gallionellaceae bacterium]|nr:antibiotic biosynthesis monooxygenase [Gallionellaceae bacterium]